MRQTPVSVRKKPIVESSLQCQNSRKPPETPGNVVLELTHTFTHILIKLSNLICFYAEIRHCRVPFTVPICPGTLVHCRDIYQRIPSHKYLTIKYLHTFKSGTTSYPQSQLVYVLNSKGVAATAI